MRKLIILCLTSLLISIAANGQTSEFTYQGKLVDNALAASGTYEMRFRLFDAETDGEPQPQAAPITLDFTVAGNNAVTVTGGVFTVKLDFTAAAFPGAPRWLEISVRRTAADPFMLLDPRQPVSSAPHNIKSLKSGSSDGLSAACVMCVTDAQILSLDGAKITGTVANAATAANVSGIVPVVNGGTGSATKNFVDLFSNQSIFGNKTYNNAATFNSGVTFNQTLTLNESLNVNGNVTADQFFGNGDGLTHVPGTFKWQTVSGLSQQALPNTGYLATNDAQVTITLPQNPGVGAIVRVSGSGIGGWKIAQNDGQSIIGAGINPSPPTWTPRETNRQWKGVASSADGTKLAAIVRNGQIHTSTDTGITWTPRESNRDWSSIASSADGTKLAATVAFGQIYTSTDSGASWTPRENNNNWFAVASSGDGTKLVAVASGGRIYTSTDSGVSWTPRAFDAGWTSVASSADGNILVAAVYFGRVYVSTNSGLTWALRTPNDGFSEKYWRTVTASADGTKLVAAGESTQIYTSINSGLNWTPRESTRFWTSVASSADGNRLVAVTDTDQIYVSSDSGMSWTPHESTRSWTGAASSADGTRLIAVSGTNSGRIYTAYLPLTTLPGTDGFITGRQYSAIELQYIGNGQFLPLSQSGAISRF